MAVQHVPMHHSMATRRARPPRMVEVDGKEIPLLNPENPNHAIQEFLQGHCRQFVLKDDTQAKAVDELWQGSIDGTLSISEHDQIWSESLQSWVVFMRWATIRLVAPKTT